MAEGNSSSCSSSCSNTDNSTSDDDSSDAETIRSSGQHSALSDSARGGFVCSQCNRVFITSRGLNCHVTVKHGHARSRASGRFPRFCSDSDYSNLANFFCHIKDQLGPCAGASTNSKMASMKQATRKASTDSRDIVYDIYNVSTDLSRFDDNADTTKSFVNILSRLGQTEPIKRRSNETYDYLAKKAKTTETSRLCAQCKTSFKNKASLINHQATCKKEAIKNPDTDKKTFACDKCDKRYNHKASLQKHVQIKHEGSDRINVKATKLKKYDCLLCKHKRVKINEHYNLKHKVVNPEEIIFHDNINLVPFDVYAAKSDPLQVKEQLKKSNQRYKDNTCRLCEYITNNLRNHYFSYHQVDAGSLNNIRDMFRAKIYLDKTDAKPKPAVEKVNATDEKEKDDNIRLIYRCECGIFTETYDATVEHSQEHLVAKHTNEEMSRTRGILEIGDGDENAFKVIKYDYKKLLTKDWLDMFNEVAVDKESILSSSIYKYTGKVKLRFEDPDCSTGILEYRCDMCQVFVDAEKIENHCFSFNTCTKTTPRKFCCEECGKPFSSIKVLEHHKKNHAVGFRTVTFNNKNDVQINRILAKTKCSNDDSQEEFVHGQNSTEKVVVNDENAVRNETKLQPQVNIIDEHADSLVNDVNNKGNDYTGTDEPLVCNDNFIQDLGHPINIIQADIHMSGDKNVAADVENTESLEKKLHDQSNVNDNQDSMNDGDKHQEKDKVKYQDVKRKNVTTQAFKPHFSLEQSDYDCTPSEGRKHPITAIQADININCSENVAADIENTGLLKKGSCDQLNTKDNQEIISGDEKHEEQVQFKPQDCLVIQESATRESSEPELQVNHDEIKDVSYDVNSEEKETNNEYETSSSSSSSASCSDVDFASDDSNNDDTEVSKVNSTENMAQNQNHESFESNFINNKDPEANTEAQDMQDMVQVEIDFSEDFSDSDYGCISSEGRIHPITAIQADININCSENVAADIENTGLLKKGSCDQLNTKDNQEIISGDEKHEEQVQFKPQDCLVIQESATRESSEPELQVNQNENKDVSYDVNSEEKETNNEYETFPSCSDVDFASDDSNNDDTEVSKVISTENMAQNQNHESFESNFINNKDPEANTEAQDMQDMVQVEIDFSEDFSDSDYDCTPSEGRKHPITAIQADININCSENVAADIENTGLLKKGSCDQINTKDNQEIISGDEKHEEQVQFKPQDCLVIQESATRESSQPELQVNHDEIKDVSYDVNSEEKETNNEYETSSSSSSASCSEVDFASDDSNNDETEVSKVIFTKNMAQNQNHESFESKFINNKDPEANTEAQDMVQVEINFSEDEITRMAPPDIVQAQDQSHQPTFIPNITRSDAEMLSSQESLVTSKSHESENYDALEVSQASGENMFQNPNAAPRAKPINKKRAEAEWQEIFNSLIDIRYSTNHPAPNDNRDNEEVASLPESGEIRSESDDDSEFASIAANSLLIFVFSVFNNGVMPNEEIERRT